MSQLAVLPQQITQSRAVSSTAYEIEVAHESAYDNLWFGTPGNAKLLNELKSVAHAHGLLENGPGRTTFQRARILLALLPFGVRPPEFSVDPDGEIAVEWYRGNDVLSISLGHSGRLAYVFDHDGKVSSGTGYLSSAISDKLLEMIKTFH